MKQIIIATKYYFCASQELAINEFKWKNKLKQPFTPVIRNFFSHHWQKAATGSLRTQNNFGRTLGIHIIKTTLSEFT